jgi:outer membrane lipoprotein carrier protein
MKKLLLSVVLTVSSYANIDNIKYFEADFTQKIKDDKNKVIQYNGHIKAAKPQYALWQYQTPVNKDVYILPNKVVIIEPDLEQVIVKKLNTNLDFFSLIKNAKKIDNNNYIASYKEKKYHIKFDKSIIKSISYKDEFDNNVEIEFKNEVQNKEIKKKAFLPNIPKDYDLITE